MIRAAKEHNFNVYLSGPGSDWRIVCYWYGDPNNPSTDKGFAIQSYLDMFTWAKNIIEGMGYDWNSPDSFIKGFYMVEEKSVSDFLDDEPVFQYYVDLSTRIKQVYPNKKILLSPYQMEDHTYQRTYDAIKKAVRYTKIDIFAPQDSVGTKKVTTFQRDREHYEALKKGIEDGNSQYGKNVELWANVETFNETGPSVWVPPDFKTLRWQVRAAAENVTKMITWIHIWSMYSVNPNYYPETYPQRVALKNEYLHKPVIIAVFQWNHNNTPHMFVKGYNFGNVGDNLGLYVHYYSTDGVNRSAQVIGANMLFDSGSNAFKEIRVNMNQFPNLDWNRPIEVAVQNKEAFWSYYRSQNPESNPDPSFSEIVAFPQTGGDSTPTAIPIPVTPPPGTIPPTAIPTPTPTPVVTPPPAVSTGLNVQYYDNMDITGLRSTTVVPGINTNWGYGAPSGLGTDTFSIRWWGQVIPRYSETYTFSTVSDDGIRVMVNNQVVINNWTDHAATENSGTISLNAGTSYQIQVEYYENGGGAEARLYWQSARQAREIVPNTQLRPTGSVITFPNPTPVPVIDIKDVFIYGTNLVIKGTYLGGQGQRVAVNIRYFKSTLDRLRKKYSEYNVTAWVGYESPNQVIYIPRTSVSSFNLSIPGYIITITPY